MGKLEECKQVGGDVCTEAKNVNSPNYNTIAGKAKSLLSGAYKMEKDFVKAEEQLNSSTEVCLLPSSQFVCFKKVTCQLSVIIFSTVLIVQ